MHRHFTATCYVIEQHRVLLIFHRKFGKWLPPGGHVDPNETPADAARREVREETGLEIEFIEQENIHINHSNARTMLRPWMCLLQNIPPSPKENAHQHMDMIYLARPTGGALCENPEETCGLRWFEMSEILMLKPEIEIFADTIETLEQIFETMESSTSARTP